MKKRISSVFCFVFFLFTAFAINAELSDKFATYEELIYPELLGDLRYVNVQAKAGQEVVFRFVKKKRTLATHPHKAMLAMAWLEILYNEMVKNPKAKSTIPKPPLRCQRQTTGGSAPSGRWTRSTGAGVFQRRQS